MEYGSICSGVEAATLAWERLGWTPKFFAEVEPFPSAVLCHRFGATRPLRPLDPAEADSGKERKLRESWRRQIADLPPYGKIPNLGDFTKIRNDDYDGKIDLLVGGFPCQSWSVSGLRHGLDDPRGNLSLEFIRLAYRTNARIILGENVPGILSCDAGEGFAEFLSLLCGWRVPVPAGGWKKAGIVTNAPGCYGVAWRILDAQYTRVPEFPRAVPQRRKRIFIVGHLDSWLYPAKVLFDGEMRGGDTPPRRTKEANVARALTASTGGCSGKEQQATFIGVNGHPLNALCMAHGQRNAEVCGEKSPTLNCNHEAPVVSLYAGNRAESVTTAADISNELANGAGPEHLNAVCYDARGNGRGDASNTIAGDHAGHISDYTPLIALAANDNGRDRMTEHCPSLHKGGAPVPDITVPGNEPELLAFIKNDAGGVQEGYWKDVFPTLRTEVTPAVAQAGPDAKTISIDPLENPIALDGDKMAKAERKGGSGLGISEEGVMYTQTVKDVHAVAYQECVPLDLRNATRNPEKHDGTNRQGVGVGVDGDPMNTVSASNVPGVGWQATVRRLLPDECERLMGFPDNHTRIPWKGKPEEECPDAPRYKACGNSMCVNVMSWIGMRINMMEKVAFAEATSQQPGGNE
ncbi:MAG: Modification methylase HaeIII [Lentisphaerae bacterium ADurb.Bin242]|nr:MAG: Modification methylase HaeIII [Lentisphaerae bacterium ADurb.Bin242]